MAKISKDIEYEALKEEVYEANEIISELKEENRKLNDKIIDLSADLGFFQNENIRLTEDIEKYWQLEQELRCPLEVIFKALKDGIVLINDILYKCKLSFIEKEWILVCYINATAVTGVSVKQHKLTWWLKGDKDEKED